MPVITEARVTPSAGVFAPPPLVFVTVDGREQLLFSFYPDEISFTPEEFIGLTLDQARALKFKKDRAYLTGGGNG